MTIVLVDFSQTVISSVAVNAKELKNGDAKNLVKHIALAQILSIKKKFPGKIILCCDAKNYWRKTEFPPYKGHRKYIRDKNAQGFDWKVVLETLDELKIELRENFPYIVLDVEGAEADDCIAAMVKYFDENELINTGLIEEPENIVICSSDLDFTQLQKYRNVRQWASDKFVVEKNPKKWLIENIAHGQSKDNIPSICNSDQWAIDRANNIPTRAKPFATARYSDFYNKGILACETEEETKHWMRNEKLIDFDMIPTAIYNKIVHEYQHHNVDYNKTKIFNYLNKHRMRLLMASVSDF